jgi:hypothetical protein
MTKYLLLTDYALGIGLESGPLAYWLIMPRPLASGIFPLPLVMRRWPIVPLLADYLNHLVYYEEP